MALQQRVCLESGQEFYPKRSNQVFATAKARNDYYNKLAFQERKKKEAMSKSLDKNRKIITQILGTSTVATKTKEFLLGAGFDFSIMTHARILDNGSNLVGIYDVAYYKLPDGEYKLLRL